MYKLLNIEDELQFFQKCLPCSSVRGNVWKNLSHCKNGAFNSVALLIFDAGNKHGSLAA